MHRDFWNGQTERYNKTYNKRKSIGENNNVLALILPLLLVLLSDGGDRFLIMALIYILS